MMRDRTWKRLVLATVAMASVLSAGCIGASDGRGPSDPTPQWPENVLTIPANVTLEIDLTDAPAGQLTMGQWFVEFPEQMEAHFFTFSAFAEWPLLVAFLPWPADQDAQATCDAQDYSNISFQLARDNRFLVQHRPEGPYDGLYKVIVVAFGPTSQEYDFAADDASANGTVMLPRGQHPQARPVATFYDDVDQAGGSAFPSPVTLNSTLENTSGSWLAWGVARGATSFDPAPVTPEVDGEVTISLGNSLGNDCQSASALSVPGTTPAYAGLFASGADGNVTVQASIAASAGPVDVPKKLDLAAIVVPW